MLGFGSWPPKIGEQKHRKNTSFETTNPVEPSQPHVNIKLRTGPSDWEAGHRKLLGFAHLQLQLLRLDGERKLLGGSNWGNRRGLKFWAVKKSTSTHFNTIAAVVVIIIVIIIIITIITIMSIMTIITIIYVCVCASLLALDSIRLYDHWVWASSLIKRGKYEGPPPLDPLESMVPWRVQGFPSYVAMLQRRKIQNGNHINNKIKGNTIIMGHHISQY